jgi:hypothetical protein
MMDGKSARPERDRLLRLIRAGRHGLVVGARASGKTRLLRDLKDALENQGGINAIMVDLGLPGIAAQVRRQGLLQVLLEQVQASGGRGPSALLLDGADREQGQLAEATALGPVVACVDPSWLGDIPAGFEKISLVPLGMRDWMAISAGSRPRLIDFLEHGGLFVSGQARPHLLLERLEQIVLRNVLMRTEVRDPEKLFGMAVDIIGNPGAPVSATRLRKVHTRSLDQARMFLSHLQAAGLIRLVGRLEDRGRRSAQASRLAYSLDTATPLALHQGLQGTEGSRSDLPADEWLRGWITNSIFIELLKMNVGVFCWRAEDRWGLAVPGSEGAEGGLLLDVRTLGQPPSRAFELAMRKTGVPRGLVLVSGPLDASIPESGNRTLPRPSSANGIQEADLLGWLLDPRLPIYEQTDMKVEKMHVRRRQHLL